MGDNEASAVRGILEKAAAAVLAAAIVAGAGALAGLHDRVVASQHAITSLTNEAVDLRKRIEQQEQRPPRVGAQVDKLNADLDRLQEVVAACRERASLVEQQVRYLDTEQARLCQRLLGCQGNGALAVPPSPRSR